MPQKPDAAKAVRPQAAASGLRGAQFVAEPGLGDQPAGPDGHRLGHQDAHRKGHDAGFDRGNVSVCDNNGNAGAAEQALDGRDQDGIGACG